MYFVVNDNRSSMEISRLDVHEEHNSPFKNVSSSLEKKDVDIDDID